MDPLSIIGLGANILQFIDFTHKLICKAREVSESLNRTTVECEDLEAVACNIIWLNSKISQSLECRNHDPRFKTESSEIDAIMSLGSSCNTVATELLEGLRTLKGGNKYGKWNGVVQAFRTIWSRTKIDDLRQRLNQYHSAMQTTLILSLRNQVHSITTEMARIPPSRSTVDRLKIDLLWAIQQRSANDEHPIHSYPNFSKLLADMTREERYLHFRSQILDQLLFRDQMDREERLPAAHKETFKWIFTNDHREGHEGKRWSDFASWLKETGDPLYWVTGKAGSGKSTLMKFVVHNPACAKLLTSWGEQMPLVILRFYFWNSGTDIQCSQEGLLRSLLYDALEQRPEDVSRLFPQRWSRWVLYGFDTKPWTIPELGKAFQALIDGAKDMYKLCMFVDGLDEFSGNHDDLISLFKEAVSCPNVKICVSSRPWVVFEESFARRPSLMLEDLTYPDIIVYISTKFNQNSGFRALQQQEPGFASTLVKNIAIKSCGVFLWVHLVVNSLLGGLSNLDRVSDLQRRLDELPHDLENFYTKMLNSIDPFYEEHAGQLFSLVAAAEGKLTALGLSFADDDDVVVEKLLQTDHIGQLHANEESFRIEAVRRRLSSRCKGLIEIPSDPYTSYTPLPSSSLSSTPNCRSCNSPEPFRLVSYLHRTVKDFLGTEAVKAKTDIMAAGYNPYPALAKSTILMVKTLPAGTQQSLILTEFVRQSLNYASAAAGTSLPIGSKMIDELCRCANAVSRRDRPGDNWIAESVRSKVTVRPETFLALTATYDLHTYILEKILGNIEIFRDQAQIPLLHRIVTEYEQYPSLCEPTLLAKGYYAPAIRIIQHISRNRPNPNTIFDGQSPWSVVLEKCILVARRMRATNEKQGPELNHWADLFELFIKMGADPRLNRNSQEASCIREAFGWSLPERAKELEKLLNRTKNRWALSRRFIMPIFTEAPTNPNDTLSLPVLNECEMNRREINRRKISRLEKAFVLSELPRIEKCNTRKGAAHPKGICGGCCGGPGLGGPPVS